MWDFVQPVACRNSDTGELDVFPYCCSAVGTEVLLRRLSRSRCRDDVDAEVIYNQRKRTHRVLPRFRPSGDETLRHACLILVLMLRRWQSTTGYHSPSLPRLASPSRGLLPLSCYFPSSIVLARRYFSLFLSVPSFALLDPPFSIFHPVNF